MTLPKFNIPAMLAALSGLGGVIGIIFTALGVGNLTSTATWVIGLVSAGLTWIAGHHATAVVRAKAQTKIALAAAVPHPPTVPHPAAPYPGQPPAT